ncbi:MAG TPA: (d)CMP kinase [Candidatus Ruania gallistercoris]|uniref:Cytidylate kinase n=1 Tax=Candidatus Ruania gallistercoris TaxID=2838746 RepID=A0A9D2J6C0_9MICO|nr:(d)CMP kinase [Candidatus Ruania gallistercoris]
MTGVVVAIDGPSGTGKSTISRRLAAELGLAYLDTGAMYRVATWWCLHRNIDLADQEAVAAAVRTLPMQIGTDPAHPTFAVDGRDVAGEIRSTRISTAVSAVATNLAVRAELQQRQREAIAAELRPASFSQGRGVIAEGRDITTVVAPEAEVRILLLADEQARLERRARELHGSTDAAVLAATRDQVVRRDADDSTVSNFTTAADGVVTVDTSTLTLDEAVHTVRTVIAAAREELTGTQETP